MMHRLTAHQLLPVHADATPQATSTTSATEAAAGAGKRRGRKSAAKGAATSVTGSLHVLSTELSETLVGARNDVAISLLCQRPLVRALLDRMAASSSASSAAADTSKTSEPCVAVCDAAAALEELRRAILMDTATGVSNALFIQISAPETVEEGKDDETLVALVHAQLDSALHHLHTSQATQPPPSPPPSALPRKRSRTSKSVPNDIAGAGAVGAQGEMLMGESGVERWGVEELAMVVAVKGSDSSYLEMAVPCALHKKSTDFAAVQLLCELLSRSEGPMWERIRGKGLAYHAGLDLWPWSGHIGFSLAECADPAAAFAEMVAILTECRAQLAAKDEASKQELAAALAEARASMLFSLHSKRATAGAAASTAAKGYWWGIAEPALEAAHEAAEIEAVDAAALQRVFERYLVPLLSPGQRCTCVVCPAGKDRSMALSLQKVLGLKSGGVTVASLPQLLMPGA